MTPEERILIQNLLDRLKATGNVEKDPEAARLIEENVRALPHASYLLVQTVLLQEEALKAAQTKLQALEAQLQVSPPKPTSFLGNLGRTFFGEPATASPPTVSAPQPSPWGRTSVPSMPPQPMAYSTVPPPVPQGGYGGAPPPVQSGTSGFLQTAAGTAAGVAGGMLLANSIQGLFGGAAHAHQGIGSSSPVGETIINNYYDTPSPSSHTHQADSNLASDSDAGIFDASDTPQDLGDDFSMGDGSYEV